MISQNLQSLAFGLLYATSALAAAIPSVDDIPPLLEAIAIKLHPQASQGSLSTRATSGAALVEELVNKALSKGNLTRRDVDFEVLPLFTTISPENIAEMVKQAAERDPTYEPVDFSTWYQIRLSDSIQSADGSIPPESLDLLTSLAGYDEVKSAQRLAGAPTQPAINPNDDPLFKNQGYLRAEGINAQYAWGFPGGDGANTTFIDIELGWHLDHEDLKAAGITIVAGDNVRIIRGAGFVRPHGTAVLGEMFMVDNGIGGVGAVTGAKAHVVGVRRVGVPLESQPEAIMEATDFLKFGDAMLLEMQVWDKAGKDWPVEIFDAEFDVIRLAVAKGITVVEPAANGGQDMDKPVLRDGDTEPRGFLVKGSPDYRESGAIMVGAGSPGLPHTRLNFSNHGARVDVYSWGNSIATTNVAEGADPQSDVSTYGEFDGTSGASPIVAGAVLSIQGMVSANRGVKLSPEAMRKLIVVGGTPSANPAQDRIGVQPNLKALIDGGHLR